PYGGVKHGGGLVALARLLAVGEVRIGVEARFRDQIGIAPDVPVAALAQIAVDLELAFARWTDAACVERPQRECLRHAVRVAVEEREDLIGAEDLRILPRERR